MCVHSDQDIHSVQLMVYSNASTYSLLSACAWAARNCEPVSTYNSGSRWDVDVRPVLAVVPFHRGGTRKTVSWRLVG